MFVSMQTTTECKLSNRGYNGQLQLDMHTKTVGTLTKMDAEPLVRSTLSLISSLFAQDSAIRTIFRKHGRYTQKGMFIRGHDPSAPVAIRLDHPPSHCKRNGEVLHTGLLSCANLEQYPLLASALFGVAKNQQ